MRWRTLAVLAMLLGVGAVGAQARQQPPPPRPAPADFRGRVVVDSVSTPIRGAFVELLGTVLRAVTDSTGGFVITGIPAGTYVVRVRAAGYLTEFFEIEAEDGLDLEGIIALRREPGDGDRPRGALPAAADLPTRASRSPPLPRRSYPSP